MDINIIDFIKHRKSYYLFSFALIVVSVFALSFWGLNLGIEFSGGSVLEAEYVDDRPPVSEIKESLGEDAYVRTIGEKGVLIRTTSSDEESYERIISALQGAEEKYFESIGPAVGRELTNRSILAILVASFLVIIYVALSFKGEELVKPGRYGFIAVSVAIFHDVLIVLGVFSVLGYFYEVQMTIPIAVAMLTTLGYSINDTVVVFDRVRENLEKGREKGFYNIVNRSLTETLGRSLATSFTTILVLLAVLVFGGSTLFYFALALVIGILLGTYSSIFLAGPLLFTLTKDK